MALLKDTIVGGVLRVVGDAYLNRAYSNNYIVNGGTSSQFLKADGSLDSNSYLTSASLNGYLSTSSVARVNTIHNGYIPTDVNSNLKPMSLCAYHIDISLLPYNCSYKELRSFAHYSSGDGTGSKSKITTSRFPIGSKIYYYSGSTVTTGAFTANQNIFSTYTDIDARYSAVTGSSISLSDSNLSDVYLRVQIVNDYYWRPYGTVNDGVEIIVDGMSLVAENFYIYLGKTSKVVNNQPWYFTLEDNNPLYYFDGRNLIPYETYIAMTLGGSVDLSGYGYGTCTNSGTSKTVTLSGYVLQRGFVSVYFSVPVPSNSTMDINSLGTKNIYAYGSAIKSGMIIAYDIATFYFDGLNYNLVNVYHSDLTIIKKELPTINIASTGGEVVMITASGNNGWPEFQNLLPGKYKVTVRRNIKTTSNKNSNAMISLRYRPTTESIQNAIPITCANVPLISEEGGIGVNTVEMTGIIQFTSAIPSTFCLDLNHYGASGTLFGGNTPYIGSSGDIGQWGNTDYIMFERIANQEPAL